MPWPCFMIEPTDRARQTLRRYTSIRAGAVCPADPQGWGHDASIPIEQATYPRNGLNGRGADDWPHDDPRWPTQCACGYVFQDEDTWQHTITRLYRPVGGGALFALRDQEIPIGAMWDAPWLLSVTHRGPDDRCLVVKTPGGDWVIDGPSRDGGGWTRTGVPPLVTARPSILTPTYHGWLTDGVLSDDLAGRTYPVVETRPADQAGGAVESSEPHD